MDSFKVEQLISRAESLNAKFEQGGGTSHINEAIRLDREVLKLCPDGHPMRYIPLIMLAVHLGNRYSRLASGATRDLEEAIVLDREVLSLCPQGHPDRFVPLNNITLHLFNRYNKLGEIRDLNEAVIFDREALNLCPQGHSHRSMALRNLASRLSARHNRLGTMQDLNEAIVHGREALKLHPYGHPDRSSSCGNLAVDLYVRYKELGETQDLEEAIALKRETLKLHPQGHPDRSMSLNNLAASLSSRYNLLGTMQDLDEAIVLDREALKLRPQGHPDRSTSLNNLALHLSTRYNQLRAMRDLDEAIVLGLEALKLRPRGHPDRSTSLNNLAVNLSNRYTQLGAMQDLDEAIALEREALKLFPQGHPDRSKSLNNIAAYLSKRYNQLGGMEDLDEAIVLGREDLNICTQGHPDRPSSLNNLAAHLSNRYTQLRAIQDLDEAIVLSREALSLRLQGHPDRSMSLSHLASHLGTRHRQLGAMQDLDEAIVLDREALNLCPPGHPDRSMLLRNFADHLAVQYNRLREEQDLEEAIVLGREALSLFPQGHPVRPNSLSELGSLLAIRYDRLGEKKEDLDEAIVLNREALNLFPRGHPDRSASLENLALLLRSRIAQSKQLEDKEELFSLYIQLMHVTKTVSPSDLSAARAWARVAEMYQHPTIVLAYETSLRLLVEHLATLPSLPQHHIILKKLTSSLAVDAFSACLRQRAPARAADEFSAYLRQRAPTRAVELLEQGRSVFWNQLTRLHSPLDDVIVTGTAGKTLADEFTRLASLIRNTLNKSGADQHERLCRLNIEMERVVTSIRELPGLSRFLLPSPFSDLQRAAIAGPVIIVNASKYSCDALVVSSDRDPVHIPMQITQDDVRELSTEFRMLTVRATKNDATREFASFLRKLWDQVVSPIVDVLQTIHPSRSRIWWCPTAEFSVLPLHAAGPYRKGQRNLPDLYISSYTPTLTALIRARRPDPSNDATQGKRFLAIGQAKAVGENELPSVGAELHNIGECVNTLATFARIDGEKSSISRVVDELGKNEWVHLACHGLPNPTLPFESAFALRDGHFTIQQIIGCDLKNPEFAYLSACHTTVGDKESPDEVIHLASAMQFLGFRSVIGTMWAVADSETIKITSTFYKHMVDESGRLDHTRAAFALNKTMKSVNVPFDQRILYIHLGV